MKRHTMFLVAILLSFSLLLTGTVIAPPISLAGTAVIAYDFLVSAPSAEWNSWKAGVPSPLNFGGGGWQVFDGEARYGSIQTDMEDGLTYPTPLSMYAALTGAGTGINGVTGDYRHVYIPANASLHVVFGFQKGEHADEQGVVVGVAFAEDDPTQPMIKLINETKDYDGSLREVRVDLSPYAGKTGGFGLFVHTSHPDDKDGVAWVQAAIEVETTTPSPPFSISPLVLKFFVGSTTYFVDTTPKTMDTTLVIVESRAFLPIRYVAQELGATVDWYPPDKVEIKHLGNTIELWIGQNSASVNGSYVLIDPGNPYVVPFIQAPGRTMMPMRFISEKLGAKVEWFPPQEARITYPDLGP
jgi:hypothetical protein